MSDYDDRLEAALRNLGPDPIDETGYYRTAFESFRGQGSGMRIIAWAAILIWSAGLIFCVIQMFRTDDLVTLIRYGIFAVLFNQAQIAMKLWFNMQLDRRAITEEVRRLGLMKG
jgi:hypothetical protein